MKTNMRKMGVALVLIAALWGAEVLAQSSAPPANLQAVMSQMDASAPKFQDAEADISVDLYTALVQEHRTQSGTSAFRRAGGAMEMVMHLAAAADQPETDLLYRNGELDVYQPAQKQETILSAGANRGEYDSMLATGFGATSKDLNAAWTVTFQGMEAVDGVQAAKLDLVPKDQSIRNNFSHFIIWVDLSRDISLKQVMVQPDGDTRTATYTNIRYNQHPAAKMFTLKVSGGTQVTHR
ncbi:MAG TPA: outer membrane lipoprotein-sorting protein [Acidobacteriaceae bacterium]